MTTPQIRRPPLIVGIFGITCICGLLDAACFLGLGNVFAEVMTGNLLYLCFGIGSAGSTSIAPHLIALGVFGVGALLAGRMMGLGGWLGEHRFGFAVEWLAVAVAVLMTFVLHPNATNQARIVVFSLLAFAMGIQNAMIRRFGIPDLATNVMTLTMTALVAESSLAGGDNFRWARRSTSVAVFAVSATLGAYLLRFGVIWPIFVAFIVFSVALPILLWGPATTAR